ncbi:MAG TPA: hypothetical protein VLB51_04890 [Methylomirabilota bacterium]|nr:hypothetical protein [Methylomirabilota bacterium]
MRPPERRSRLLLAVCAATLVGCGGGPGERAGREVAPIPRRMVVWLNAEGVDAVTADRLAASGVDQLVVRRGSVLLSGAAPVVRLADPPPIAGSIPTAVALEVRGRGGGDHEAEAVWAALAADFGERLPAELVLDLPDLGEETHHLVTELARESGLAVVPLLTVSQIATEDGRAVLRAARACVVPVFGTVGGDLRGVDELDTQKLADRLEPVARLGARVRLAAALRPRTEPAVAGWAADLDPLTEEEDAEIRRASALDRSFLVERPLTWAGRDWAAGEEVAVAWVDTAKLRAFLAESHRMVLPELVGWDLVSLPPPGPNLGLDRDELIRFLGGEGPEPAVAVRLERNGRTVVVELVNDSVFRSAVTGFGNWVQVELDGGALVASSRGGFDRIILGTVAGGQWQPSPAGGPDAVRFAETYLAPGESLRSGTIRLPSNRSRVVVRWQVQLSDGSAVTGVVE